MKPLILPVKAVSFIQSSHPNKQQYSLLLLLFTSDQPLIYLFSLAAHFFAMNPFEPWTTPDKVERVRARFLFFFSISLHLKAFYTLIHSFAFPVSHNRHEVPGTARSGGPGHHSVLCRAKGYRSAAAPPRIPLPGN